MARYRLQGSALTTIGGAVRVVPGATITFTAKGASAPATLYESNTGTSNYGTSVTADENGQYDVYVEYAEYYDAEFAVGSRTVDERFYLDPSEAVLEAKDEAFDARDKAKQWANEDEDVAVENGEYSAKHWSKKAQAIVVSSVESVIDDTISDAKKGFDGRALTKAELIASPDVVVGQSVDVLEVGRVILVPASTYTANGSTVIDLTGSGLQAVLAPGEELADRDALLTDPRPGSWFPDGTRVRANTDYVKVADAEAEFDPSTNPDGWHIQTSGGAKFHARPVWGGAQGGIYTPDMFAKKGNWDNASQSGDDAQSAFQRAVYVAEVNGGDVYIPYPEPGKEWYLGSHVKVGATGKKLKVWHSGGMDSRIVRKAGDDYAFVIEDNPGADFCTIEGFAISGQGPSNAADNDGSVENYPPVLSRRRSFLKLGALYCGGPNYPGYTQFSDTGSGSKCFVFGLVTNNTGGSYSRWDLGAKQCYGDTYFCGTEAGSKETQAQEVHIWTSYQNVGYAFNIHKGFRNRVTVQHCEGANHTAIGRLGDADSWATTIYCEGNVGTGYVFDGGANYAEMQNETMATPFVANNNNNEYRCYGPIRKHYLGLNGAEFSGGAPNFTNGIKIGGRDFPETGTYTATLSPGTSGTITLDSSFEDLAYERIGSTVLVTGQINVASVSSPTGSIVEVTLPFNIANLAGLGGRFYTTVYRNDTNEFLALNGIGEGGNVARIIVDASTITSADSFGFGFSYRAE